MFKLGANVLVDGKEFCFDGITKDGHMAIVDSEGSRFTLGHSVIAQLTSGALVTRGYSTDNGMCLYIHAGGKRSGPYKMVAHTPTGVYATVERRH